MKEFIKDNLLNSLGRLNSRKLNRLWFSNNGFTDEYQSIIHCTAFAPDSMTLSDRINVILNDITEMNTCLKCHKKHLRIVERNQFSEYCSVKCAKASDEKRNKTEKTNLRKYGVKYYSQTGDARKKISDVMTRHWKDNPDRKIKSVEANRRHIPKHILAILNSPERLSEELVAANRLVQQLASNLGVYYGTVISRLREYDMYNGNHISFNASKGELEVLEFIKSLGVDVIPNYKINQYEVDIYIPEYNLAIEYNGLYWHSEKSGGKNSKYHLNKTILCEDNNIQLLHIFENEWADKTDIWKSIIKSKLGRNNTVGARQCEVREAPYGVARAFLDNNHMQGNGVSSIRLGLYLRDELVGLMTFAKPRYNKDYDFEIIRYCSKLNLNVIGGASKLLSHFRKAHTGTIISYANRRWSDGGLYDSLGFDSIGSSSPNFFVTKGHYELESRLKYQKHKLAGMLDEYDNTISAWDNLVANGYDRIWDSGNMVYILK